MRVLAQVATLAIVPSLAVAGAATPPAPAEPVGGVPLGVRGEPVVDNSSGVPTLPDVEAAAWLVADLDGGGVLAAFNAHEPLPPASTIKLLTALVLLPGLEDDLVYTASDAAARVEGSRVGLVPDQTYTRADLEHGLLLASGNDAAHALTEFVGEHSAAVDLMNAEAVRLGAFDTQALTPHGLDEPGQVSSAYDLALIGRAVLAEEGLAQLVRTRTYDFPGLDGETFQIQNQNRLLGRYDGAIGLKTGYTTEAGHTLVAAAERDGVRLIATVLDAEGRAEPVAEALLDWGFAATGSAVEVGRLITPDEAAAVLDAAAQQAEMDGTPGAVPIAEDEQDGETAADQAADVSKAPGVPTVPLPMWLVAGLVLVVTILLVTVVVRWRTRPRTGRFRRA